MHRGRSFRRLERTRTNSPRVSHVGDVNACRYFEHKLSGEFFSCSFPMKWRFPSWTDPCKQKEMDLHNISTRRRGVATSKSPQRLSNNHNARIPTFITCLYCTIVLFLYQYVGKHLVFGLFIALCVIQSSLCETGFGIVWINQVLSSSVSPLFIEFSLNINFPVECVYGTFRML